MIPDLNSLIDCAVSIFRCGPSSVHGPRHWKNVHEAGELICAKTDADPAVVTCFAFFHDCCRLDDGEDLEHGPRAADMLPTIRNDVLPFLNDSQFDLLEQAIRYHTGGKASDDPTIGACWDSDRLDLGRVGIIPSALYMSTGVGRDIARLGSRMLYLESLNR